LPLAVAVIASTEMSDETDSPELKALSSLQDMLGETGSTLLAQMVEVQATSKY